MDLAVNIKKLDARFAGFPRFKYRVAIKPAEQYSTTEQRIRAFHLFRDWCIESFGMSCERDDYITLKTPYNPHWAWHYDTYAANRYFYFTESGVEWVKLKWL
jgi:hypothetical protein